MLPSQFDLDPDATYRSIASLSLRMLNALIVNMYWNEVESMWTIDPRAIEFISDTRARDTLKSLIEFQRNAQLEAKHIHSTNAPNMDEKP